MVQPQAVEIRSCPLPDGGECVEIIRRDGTGDSETLIESPRGESPVAVACARFLMARGYHVTDDAGVRLRAEEVE